MKKIYLKKKFYFISTADILNPNFYLKLYECPIIPTADDLLKPDFHFKSYTSKVNITYPTFFYINTRKAKPVGELGPGVKHSVLVTLIKPSEDNSLKS